MAKKVAKAMIRIGDCIGSTAITFIQAVCIGSDVSVISGLNQLFRTGYVRTGLLMSKVPNRLTTNTQILITD